MSMIVTLLVFGIGLQRCIRPFLCLGDIMKQEMLVTQYASLKVSNIVFTLQA